MVFTEKHVMVINLDNVNIRYGWPKLGGTGREKVGILMSSSGESKHIELDLQRQYLMLPR